MYTGAANDIVQVNDSNQAVTMSGYKHGGRGRAVFCSQGCRVSVWMVGRFLGLVCRHCLMKSMAFSVMYSG